MDDDTLIDFLESLAGHGVYKVGIIYELERFGFKYVPKTDELGYGIRWTTLNARTPEQMQAEMDADPKGGVLDEPRLEGKVIDAVDISSAIVRLIAPGAVVPSSQYFGRGRSYKEDVELIARTWRIN